MARSRPHICDPSYDLTGTCKFCKSKPCGCDEKIPRGFQQVTEKVFFTRRPADAPRLAAAACEGTRRGPIRNRSSWAQTNILRSLLESVDFGEFEESEVNGLLALDGSEAITR